MVKIAGSALLLSITTLAAWGCAPKLTCDETFSSGGEVVGATDSDADGVPDSRWVVTEPCEDIVSSPPEPVTLQKQPPHLSGSSPPKEASGEWCMNLSLLKDAMGTPQVNEFYPWIPRLPLRQRSAPGQPVWYDAYVHYARGDAQNGRYTFGAVLAGQHRIELPARCLIQQGVPVTCQDLIPLLTEKYAEADARLGRSTGAVSTANWACGNQANGRGCECAFNMTVSYDPTTGPGGSWEARPGDVLAHFDEVGGGAAFLSNYSVEGSTLMLSGYHRRALFGIDGLRTLKLQQVVCNDAAQGVGEDGMDCGSNCPGNPPCP